MIPIKYLRPVHLMDIQTPAIVLPVGKYGEPFFVVGKGEEAVAAFIGEAHTFETMPALDNTHWRGLAIEGLEIEVDPTSAYSLEESVRIIGSVVREGSGLALIARAQGPHGFKETFSFPIHDDLQQGAKEMRVGFARWKAVLRDGDRIVYEHSFEATETER